MTDPILATAHKTVPQVPAKACHVICLGNGKQINYFITIDKPDLITNFVLAKGFFVDQDKDLDFIVSSYQALIKEIDKDKIVEITFPSEKVNFIRSLVFKQK